MKERSLAADDASTPRDLRAALRNATAAWHGHLDRSPDQRALLGADITLERYGAIMTKHHHALVMAEAMLASLAAARPTDLPPYRPRLPALAADLATLGALRHSSLRAGATDAPTRSARASDGTQATGRYLGARYVLEGSTQGATAIARRLERHLPTLGPSASGYWRVQAEETPAWQALTLTLASHPARGELASAAIAAARDTFGVFLRAFGLDAPVPADPNVDEGPIVGSRR